MARGDKRVELKTVDETEHEQEEVVRLESEDGDRGTLVRLKVHPKFVEPEKQRLDVVARENYDARSFQPGIEALIENPEAAPAPLEQNWGRDPAAREAIPWGWFVLIALVLAGALIWSITRVNKAEDQARQIRVETKSVLGQDAREEKEAGHLIEVIQNATHEFFQSRNINEMVAMVRQPERVRPLMEGYYNNSEHRILPTHILRTTLLQPLTLDNRANFWMESVELENHGKKNLVVEIVASGEAKIDWETLVCYQPMPWDSFATQRPEGSSMDFRVYAEPDNFFSHEFADPLQWDCYRITALDSDETLFGYCRKTDESAPLIRAVIDATPAHKASLILRLGIPTGLQSRRGVVIEKLLSSRWLYLEPPGDEP